LSGAQLLDHHSQALKVMRNTEMLPTSPTDRGYVTTIAEGRSAAAQTAKPPAVRGPAALP